jgi:Protein of unknown function (DUF3179)
MPSWLTRFALIAVPLLVAAAAFALLRPTEPDRPTSGEQKSQPTARTQEPTNAPMPEEVALPETPPPPGLPILAARPRDTFRVIRKPWLLPANQGDIMLGFDEPVLGLVIHGDVRAYSTNQLNDHEMVLDDVGGTPVLVSY